MANANLQLEDFWLGKWIPQMRCGKRVSREENVISKRWQIKCTTEAVGNMSTRIEVITGKK